MGYDFKLVQKQGQEKNAKEAVETLLKSNDPVYFASDSKTWPLYMCYRWIVNAWRKDYPRDPRKDKQWSITFDFIQLKSDGMDYTFEGQELAEMIKRIETDLAEHSSEDEFYESFKSLERLLKVAYKHGLGVWVGN